MSLIRFSFLRKAVKILKALLNPNYIETGTVPVHIYLSFVFYVAKNESWIWIRIWIHNDWRAESGSISGIDQCRRIHKTGLKLVRSMFLLTPVSVSPIIRLVFAHRCSTT